ncbi:MAG TPA: triple tyrosine motif-containing protein, partial [Opitutaceae bacterium]|nr:triple tyrosine motif-containing protein [Opitutaceae bacterium]
RLSGNLRNASAWSGSQAVVCRTRDHRLLFATREGILAVDPKRVPGNSNPPPVYLEKVAIDGRLTSIGDGVKIPAGSRDLVLEYTAVSFLQPNEVYFKYKLDGYDNEWTDARNQRSAHYTKLPPGKFVFRVKACNADGIWNETGAQILLTQEPYFYQTGWFYAAVACGILGIGVGVYRWSHRRLVTKLERLEEKQAMEKERRRIAKNLHDDLGANLTEIGLFADAIQKKISSPEAAEQMSLLSDRVRNLAGALDTVVWAVNPANDSLDKLASYISGYFQDICRMAEIACRLDVTTDLPPHFLSPEQRSNIFLTVKEAVNNVIKHSGATEAWLRIKMQQGAFHLEIEDNGCGFVTTEAIRDEQYGLLNMRSRVVEMKGTFELNSTLGKGTRIALSIPFATEKMVVKSETTTHSIRT